MLDRTQSLPTGWNAEKIVLLRRLWDDGLTCSQIAANFNSEFSRSAIIGKAHRLDLPSRRDAVFKLPYEERERRKQMQRIAYAQRNTVRQRERRQEERAQREEQPETLLIAPQAQPCTLLELTDTRCKWPNGDVGVPGFHFCGAPKQDDIGIPYCAYHNSIAHQAAPARRDRRPFIN